MGWPENAETAAGGSSKEDGSGFSSTGLSAELGAGLDARLKARLAAESGAELERKARIAFGLYLVLGVVAWFTLDGTVQVYGRPIELRLVPLIVLGGLAARTLLAVKAEKIRRASSRDREESLKG
jgi:hypothetical protein